MTTLICLKYRSGSHDDVPKSAVGGPQRPGSGFLPMMSCGIRSRGQCQILMCSDVHSSAYTPPRAALNVSPYVAVSDSGGTKLQPALLLSWWGERES